jgi:riboflavin synthase
VFTGIVEERGSVESITDLGDAARIAIRGPLVTSDAAPGDSIAVNGVCLTVVDIADGVFTADVMQETLVRSSLGRLVEASPVNLERAARIDSRLGVATVLGIAPTENWTTVTFAMPDGLTRYVVEKGSITVDGVSLTVVAVDDSTFAVSLIPTTLAHTTLGVRRAGDLVNIEVDVIAKYVERLMEGRAT